MGITIHYSGKLNNLKDIGKVQTELSDIAKELNWTYTVIDDAEQQVNGIIIKPHTDSESLSILVNKNLHLISLVALSLNEANEESAKFVAIKTQFAPLHVHISVIKLLKYIKKKYVSNLKVIDESDFWNSGDENILKEKMDFLASRIDLFGDVLDAHFGEFEEMRSPKEIAGKLEEILKKLGFENNI